MNEKPAVFTETLNPLAKAGTWLFCEFELNQVKEVEGERIVGVSDGYCSMSSYDLSDRCFPLEMDVKQISDLWEWENRKLHAEGGPRLNHPDIHRYMVETWVEACRIRHDQEALTEARKKFREWVNETWWAIRDRKQYEVGGVRLFGR